MKQVVSFSLDEDTILKVREKLRSNKSLRSKSHLVEEAVKKFLKGDNDG